MNVKGNAPNFNVKEIQDPYIQKNFRELQDYFNKENQLYGFKFLEVNITSAVTKYAIAHGCGYVPQDVIVTRITGAGVASFLYPSFDSTNIYITTTDACRIRMLVGTYWNQQTKVGNNASDLQQWAAKPTTTSSTVVSSSTTATPFTILGDNTTSSQTVALTPAQFLAMMPQPQAWGDPNCATANGTIWTPYAFICPGVVNATGATGGVSGGAVYAINGVNYQLQFQSTVNGHIVYAGGPSAPPSSGTLVLVSGTGDASITYTSVVFPQRLEIELQGGGGGGGGTANVSNGAGGGGGGGGFVRAVIYANGGGVTLANTYTFVCGALGTGGNNTGTNGNNGTASTWSDGTNTWSAGGGNGGTGSSGAGGAKLGGAGGGTGTVNLWDYAVSGGPGQNGTQISGNGGGGMGGGSYCGGAGSGATNSWTTPSVAGIGTGAGGGGGGANAGAQAASNGANGNIFLKFCYF